MEQTGRELGRSEIREVERGDDVVGEGEGGGTVRESEVDKGGEESELSGQGMERDFGEGRMSESSESSSSVGMSCIEWSRSGK